LDEVDPDVMTDSLSPEAERDRRRQLGYGHTRRLRSVGMVSETGDCRTVSGPYRFPGNLVE
jgi:hypothetical protein